MGCLIKMVKHKGTLKNLSFLHLERVPKKDNQYLDTERNKIKTK
jgi:hypothetical protein